VAGFITGCGGGGGASAPDPVVPTTYVSPPTSTVPDNFFQEYTEYMVEDTWSVISQICNDSRFRPDSTQAFSMIPVHLNDDKYVDFISHYWCSTTPGTTLADVETPNVLIAHVSDGYGNWYIDNYRVFGEDLPSIGGAGRKWTRGDFNADGHDDFAFAVNWEDLRTDDIDGSRWDTYQTVLLSTGDGAFTIETGGTRSMGHAVAARPNQYGYDDVLFAGMLGTLFQSYRFEPHVDAWTETTPDYNPDFTRDWAIDMQVIDQDQLVSGYCDYEAGQCGIALFQDSEQGWQVSDQKLLPKVFDVYIDGHKTAVHQIGDHYTVGVATDEMCKLDNFSGNGNSAVAVELWGSSFREDILVEDGYNYSNEDLENYRNLKVYEIANGKMIDKHPETTAKRYNAYYMECTDLNNDGFSDVLIQKSNRDSTYQSDPIVYINNNGELTLYQAQDEDHFPDHSGTKKYQYWGGVSRLIDVDSDGLVDLVTFNTYPHADSVIEIYKALKPLE